MSITSAAPLRREGRDCCDIVDVVVSGGPATARSARVGRTPH
jgi:hypothetical protein